MNVNVSRSTRSGSVHKEIFLFNRRLFEQNMEAEGHSPDLKAHRCAAQYYNSPQNHINIIFFVMLMEL